MKRLLTRLWTDDDGFVLSSEMMMYGTLGVVGVTTGVTALRDSVNSELDDVAKALGSMDQSYYIGGVYGHSAFSAGSMYVDRADRCDYPSKCVQVVAPGYQRPTVCADVFGPNAHPAVPAVPGYGYGPGFAPPPGPHHPHPHHPPVMKHDRDDDQGRKDGKQKEDDGDKDGIGRKPEHHAHHRPHGDPHPAMIVGAPGLVPLGVGFADERAVRVMLNPFNAGAYSVNVPEGFFNAAPGTFLGAPCYQFCLPGHRGYYDCGYAYGPATPGVVQAPAGRGPDTIDLGFTKIGDDELKHVQDFKTARCLHVLGSNVTNKGLAYIAELEQLESLHIVGTQITDEGVGRLAELKNLRFLHLIGTRVTDAGLKNLHGMKHLEEIDLRGSAVTEEGLVSLQKALPTLRVIR